MMCRVDNHRLEAMAPVGAPPAGGPALTGLQGRILGAIAGRQRGRAFLSVLAVELALTDEEVARELRALERHGLVRLDEGSDPDDPILRELATCSLTPRGARVARRQGM